jgi:hypothetical protein
MHPAVEEDPPEITCSGGIAISLAMPQEEDEE